MFCFWQHLLYFKHQYYVNNVFINIYKLYKIIFFILKIRIIISFSHLNNGEQRVEYVLTFLYLIFTYLESSSQDQ